MLLTRDLVLQWWRNCSCGIIFTENSTHELFLLWFFYFPPAPSFHFSGFPVYLLSQYVSSPPTHSLSFLHTEKRTKIGRKKLFHFCCDTILLADWQASFVVKGNQAMASYTPFETTLGNIETLQVNPWLENIFLLSCSSIFIGTVTKTAFRYQWCNVESVKWTPLFTPLTHWLLDDLSVI